MSSRAKVFIFLVSAAGASILAYNLLHWTTARPIPYIVFSFVALFASGMKVRIPGVEGTMSMNFIFVLLGLAEWSLPETLLVGCAGILVQSLVSTTKRPQHVQVAFNVASMACSVAAAYQAYHLPEVAGKILLVGNILEDPLRLLLAAATFFVTNTLSIAAVIALTEHKNVWELWRKSYFWSFPNYLVGAAIAVMMSAAGRMFGWQTSLLLLPVLYLVYRSHAAYVSRLEGEKQYSEERRKHAEEMAALHHRTITTLALAIEAKDQTTADHLERVQTYAMEVGRELGLSEVELDALGAAALLHDIGKLAVPEYIISKPGRLTPEEFEKMKIHPVVGAELLERVQFPYPVAPIVRGHHEKWDGTGYPDGLAGTAIPIGARILGAVDCLDALATDRQYRRALPLDEAMAAVVREAGRSFDPQVVAVLAKRYRELEEKARGGLDPAKLSARLSMDVKVERGGAPAAGFENAGAMPQPETDLANLRDSLAETARQSRMLAELTAELERCEFPAQAYSLLRRQVGALAPYHAAVFYRRVGNRLAPEWVDGEEQELFASLEIPLGMGLSGWVAENNMAIVNGNPSVEPGYLDDPSKFSTLRSALAVPVKGVEGVLGVLALYHRNRDAFSRDHLTQLLALESRLARVLDRAAFAEQPTATAYVA